MGKLVGKSLDWASRIITLKTIFAALFLGAALAALAWLEDLSWTGRILALLLAVVIALAIVVLGQVAAQKWRQLHPKDVPRNAGGIAVRWIIGIAEQNTSRVQELEEKNREIAHEKVETERALESSRASIQGLSASNAVLLARLQESHNLAKDIMALAEKYDAMHVETEERFQAAMWTVGNMLTVLSKDPAMETGEDRMVRHLEKLIYSLNQITRATEYGNQFYGALDFYLNGPGADPLGHRSEGMERFRAIQSITIGVAEETDTALPITPGKSKLIGLAEEADTALPMTRGPSTPDSEAFPPRADEP